MAEHSDVSIGRVKAFERGEWIHPNHVKAMKAALESAGVVFSTDVDGNPCVSLHANGDGTYEIVRRGTR